MPALFAIAILVLLLYIPGYCIACALLGDTPPPDRLERHYERIVAGALLNGWLAFTLAELGIFSAWLHLLVLLLICAGCAVVARRRGALRLPQAPLGIVARSVAAAPDVRAWLAANWETLAFAAVGVVFAVLVARPFEVVLGARDAGVYANTGFAIARHGGIVQHDALVAQIGQDRASADPALRDAAAQAETNFLGVQDRERFIATRLRTAGFFIYDGELASGRVVPQFFHLYPAWIGLLASLLGLQGGLLATGLMGLLGVWSVGMLGRRLAGPWVGLLAMSFLALNGVQVWFSRYSTSESTAQFLTFAGLYAFAAAQHAMAGEQAGGRQATCAARHALFAALLAGIAFGQIALTRIEFLLLAGPLTAYLLYTWLTRRWRRPHTIMAAGLGIVLLQAALHIALIARDYFFSTLFARLQDQSAILATLSMPFLTPVLRQVFAGTSRSVLKNPARLWIELALVAALCVALYLLRRDGRPLRLIERAVVRQRRLLLRCAALSIVLVAAYGYLIRPQILSTDALSALPDCLTPAQLNRPTGDCLALQGYIGAPIDPPTYPNQVAYFLDTLPSLLKGHTPPPRASTATELNDKIAIYQANMVRVGWYLSPLGVVLGVLGFALWWRRGMDRAAWLFLGIGLLTSFFFIRQSYGTSDATYIYIARRYVPQVYPTFCLGIAYALVALSQGSGVRSQESGVRSQELDVGASQTQNSKLKTQNFSPSPVRRWRLAAAILIALALAGFLVATDRPIYAHAEYSGALAQLNAIASRFDRRDVLLFRGAGPTYADARDKPDMIVTPLKYAFDLNAFTIKSKEPGKYAAELARYVQRWQAEGRQVYLVLGASGGIELPGFRLERIGTAALQLREFEQLADQKPRNVQDFDLDFAIYRLEPVASAPAAMQAAISIADYAAQVRGFYHPEQIDAATLDWTNGDALLRLPWPQDNAPRTITLQLAGGRRPAAIGAARVCLALRPETSFWVEDPAAAFTPLGCFDLTEQMAGYSLTLDPRNYPASTTGSALLRLQSETWQPAQLDPALHDQRALGIQFGGLTIRAQ